MTGVTSYLNMLKNLLPVGQAWTAEPDSGMEKTLIVAATELARGHQRIDAALEESDPRTTMEMLTDWEFDLGLPDECTDLADTVQERRARVIQKHVMQGGQSRQFFIDLAALLGYAIAITEYRPFICGISRCGDRLGGGHTSRFFWKVTVPEPRATRFRAGISRCGERLLSIARAEDLECILNRFKPAQSTLLFNYEGA